MEENQTVEEDFIDVSTKVVYKGECYRFIQYGNMKLVLKEVEENGKMSYQVPPLSIREELLKLMNLEVISKIKEKKEEKENSKIKESSKKRKKKRLKVAIPLMLAAGILISLHKYNNYHYVGLDYDKLLNKLSDDSLELQKILEENLNFQDNEYYGSFSDSEKEEFRNRAERFASYLTEEEQELFKYQLNKVTIRKSDSTNFFHFRGESILNLYKRMHTDDFELELAFCKMMQECYMKNEKDYYVFNNQQFLEPHRVELGDNFPFYNTIFILQLPRISKSIS